MTENISAYRVLSVRASEDGDRIYIRLEMPAPDGGRSHRVSVSVRPEEYAALPFSFKAEMPLDEEEAMALLAAADASAAYGRGLSILGYGANSAKTLERKLTQKGFDREVAARAVGVLTERGYLQEERDACRMAGQLLRRGRGRRRILQELRARGYGDAALQAVREELNGEDFAALCTDVLRKKSPRPPADRTEKQKLAAYLARCGFEGEDIRAAFVRAWSR